MTILTCILFASTATATEPGELLALHEAGTLNLPDGTSGIDRGSIVPHRDWPDYEASETYFGPRRAGFTLPTELDQAILASMDVGALTGPYRGSPLTQPVLVLTSGLLILSARQTPYLDSYHRRCPTCLTVTPVAALPEPTRRLILARIDFMVKGGAIPLPPLGYDTAVELRRPETWEEKVLPRPLSVVIRPALAGDRQARSRFVRDYLLSPHDLRYVRLVGPTPEDQPPLPTVDDVPGWVRYRYAEWDDMAGAFRMASDAWIRGGWREVRRACPDCEDWSDWYCGSHGDGEWSPTLGAFCRENGEGVDRDRPGHGYLPGDTSPAGWQYTLALRRPMGWPEYLENQIPIIDPEIELPALVRRQEARVRESAHELADRWCGEGGA